MAVNTCQFKIWVEQVCKSVLKPFPNGLYRYRAAEKQRSWPSRLLDIANYIVLKRVCPIHTPSFIKFAYESAIDKL